MLKTFDYVKQYKGNINEMPREYKEVLKEKFIERYGKENLDKIKDYQLEINVYISINLGNSYKK